MFGPSDLTREVNILINSRRELALLRIGVNWWDCVSCSVSWRQATSLAVSICCLAGIHDVSCREGGIQLRVFVCMTNAIEDDVQKRFSIFYLIGCVASALSGILAFGLMQLNGQHGLTGWRWIFILEGVVCNSLIRR